MLENSAETLIDKRTKKHPKGLWLLIFTEIWERFSYYGMRAILVLYLTTSYLQGGLGIDEGFAQGVIYGTFTGLVYFTPLIGGWLADKYLGQRISITIGGFTMMFGQLCLFAINTHFGMYLGLLLLILGNGLFKPNIATLVGKLYGDDNSRKDSAFTYFYMGVNLGAFIAPIAIGFITDYLFATKDASGQIMTYGYKYAFLAAAIGMFTGQIAYNLLGKRILGDLGLKPEKVKVKKENKTIEYENKPLTKVEKDRVAVIFIFFIFAVMFFAGFEQAGTSLTLYANKYIDRTVGGWEIPVPMLQSINPFFIISLGSVFAWFWMTKWGQRLTAPLKMGIGMVILGIGFFFMLGAVAQRGGDVADEAIKANLLWLVFTYLFHTIGELCLSPVGMSTVSKMSPPKLASILMAVWFLSSCFANIIGGQLAATVSSLGAGKVFLYISIFVIVCGLLLIALSKKIQKMMHGIR